MVKLLVADAFCSVHAPGTVVSVIYPHHEPREFTSFFRMWDPSKLPRVMVITERVTSSSSSSIQA